MKILIAGTHGMIGSAVTPLLKEQGHEIVPLVRHKSGAGEVWWDPDAGLIETAGLEGFDGVVNLASKPWPMRWTAKAKQTIRLNRIATNRLLAESLACCTRKPGVLVCAAGMGYYASSGDEVLTEDCPGGTRFLSVLDQDGEAATAPASSAGIRVVHLRIPMVLGGDRLKQIGFQAGDGRQWMSWVGRDELAYIIDFVLKTQTLAGAVNAVSPNPLRSSDFARTATRAMGQKPGGSMPAFVVRLVMGEMGEEFALASRRIRPQRLLDSGYQFRYANLEDALRHEMAVQARMSQPA